MDADITLGEPLTPEQQQQAAQMLTAMGNLIQGKPHNLCMLVLSSITASVIHSGSPPNEEAMLAILTTFNTSVLELVDLYAVHAQNNANLAN